MNQKFCYLSQRTQRKQRCAFTKNDVRLWDFGTLKSHSLKVSVQIFTIFQHLRYRYPVVTFGMIAKWKTSTAGVERCPLDTCNTNKKRQSRVRIQFLAARATIISNETDEERTCLLGGGAGRSSDRSGFRVIDRSKGVILPLDLGECRFCLHGG
jgi:hypothetical protein